MVRSPLKRLIEQALLAEQDRYLELGYYEHAPVSRLDYRNGFSKLEKLDIGRVRLRTSRKARSMTLVVRTFFQ